MGRRPTETSILARDWLDQGRQAVEALPRRVRLHGAPERQARRAAAAPATLKKLAVASSASTRRRSSTTTSRPRRASATASHAPRGGRRPVALNVGDFLLGEGYRLIGELDVEPAVKVEMLRAAAAGPPDAQPRPGQGASWTRNPGPLASIEVLDIFRQKTAPAFEVALTLGAFLGEADEETHEVLRKYSESLGIAYQIRDDIEDCTARATPTTSSAAGPSVILAIALKRAEEGPREGAAPRALQRESAEGERRASPDPEGAQGDREGRGTP
jgi:geranylgeranyl pyrophosphate synthase